MKCTSPGFRSVEACSIRAAAVIFAERAARKHYGKSGYCRTCTQVAHSTDGRSAEYSAFISYRRSCAWHPASAFGATSRGRLQRRRSTVKKVLEVLGFRVLRVAARDSRMWALCANPSRYRIREALKHLGIDYWLVGRADVREGDAVAVWQTRDAEGHRGVVALGQIVGEPETRRDSENPFWVSVDDAQSEGIRVPVRYQRLSTPLWVDDTEVGQFLASLSVARAQGGDCISLDQRSMGTTGWSRRRLRERGASYRRSGSGYPHTQPL